MKRREGGRPTDRCFVAASPPEAWNWQPEPARQLASPIPVLGPEVGQQGTQPVAYLRPGAGRAGTGCDKADPLCVFWSWLCPPTICAWLPGQALSSFCVPPSFRELWPWVWRGEAGPAPAVMGGPAFFCLLVASPPAHTLFLLPIQSSPGHESFGKRHVDTW